MNRELWEKIENFELDDPEADFSFTERLARENRWSVKYTRKVILEYKKFLYLCCEAGHPVTPSDQVDQAWHLHLCYTRSYWQDLCRDILSKKIHHGPTRGGSEEKEKYHDWYKKTLETYQLFFGQEPPEDCWPKPKHRFSSLHFERVNREKVWVIPKLGSSYIALLLLSLLFTVGCFSEDPNFSAKAFIAFLIITVIVVLMIAFKGGKWGGCSGGTGGCDSGCGGCGGCGG